MSARFLFHVVQRLEQRLHLANVDELVLDRHPLLVVILTVVVLDFDGHVATGRQTLYEVSGLLFEINEVSENPSGYRPCMTTGGGGGISIPG